MIYFLDPWEHVITMAAGGYVFTKLHKFEQNMMNDMEDICDDIGKTNPYVEERKYQRHLQFLKEQQNKASA